MDNLSLAQDDMQFRFSNYNEAYFTRLASINLKNFRNIKKGTIVFPNSAFKNLGNQDGSITGLYGQNGSGKTSVVIAIELLKDIITTGSIDYDKYSRCVMYGESSSTLTYEFNSISRYDVGFSNGEKEYNLIYQFDISVDDEKKIIGINNESIKARWTTNNGNKISLHTIIDSGDLNDPKNRSVNDLYKKTYVNYDKNFNKILRDTLEEHKGTSLSLIFGSCILYRPFNYLIEKYNRETYSSPDEWKEVDPYKEHEQDYLEDSFTEYFYNIEFATSMLLSYCSKLYIINTSNIGITGSKKYIPLHLPVIHDFDNEYYFKYKDEYDFILLSLEENATLQTNPVQLEQIISRIQNLNTIINAIVPGLSIEFSVLRNNSNSDSTINYTIYSVRNNKRIPIKDESDGVRRIISLACLFSCVYNNPGFTAVIDEIDACIFEYLLGEIIDVLNESAKGQLIFTSHNLRLLEVLKPKNIYFTTTDENNRFVRITTLSGNNNLRDCYYRNIILGGKDCLYEPTERYKIEAALIKADKQDI